MKLRLKERAGPPILGWNMHVLTGHTRLTFVQKYMKRGQVLDVACGEGGFSIYLADHGNAMTAIDILPSPVHERCSKVKFVQMDAFDMKWSGVFDTILLMEIMEHVVNVELLVELCQRALRQGGVLLTTTPHVDTWDGVLDHVWRFDQPEVEKMLRRSFHHVNTFCDETFVYGVAIK